LGQGKKTVNALVMRKDQDCQSSRKQKEGGTQILGAIIKDYFGKRSKREESREGRVRYESHHDGGCSRRGLWEGTKEKSGVNLISKDTEGKNTKGNGRRASGGALLVGTTVVKGNFIVGKGEKVRAKRLEGWKNTS